MEFQSTSPVWGTTLAIFMRISIYQFQSTSPVWGTTGWECAPPSDKQFQSTSPVWGTTCVHAPTRQPMTFQSTSPVWGTTSAIAAILGVPIISIHVPRVGDDPCAHHSDKSPAYFNPRPPCGGRHIQGNQPIHTSIFQSTSPVWGTTR